MQQRVFYLLLFLTFSFASIAQEQCLDFEDLPLEFTFGASTEMEPGDELITQSGATVTVEPFNLTTNSTNFGDAIVTNDSIAPEQSAISGQYLRMDDVSLKFDFGTSNVVGLSFDFVELFEQINISVNGQPIQIYRSFFEMPIQIAEDIEVVVELDENTPVPTGTVTLYGQIETFQLGGEMLAIDNICATLDVLSNCIEFENLPADSAIGRDSDLLPGDLLLEEDGVVTTLGSFTYFDNSTDFWNVTPSTNIFNTTNSAFSGQMLFVSNITLQFDFTALPLTTTSVSFAFIDGGGEENIAVNGEEVLVVNNLGEVPTEIAPGVTMTIAYDTLANSNLPTGVVTLSGKIETLTIGGQEFALDKVCYTLEAPETLCSIDAVNIDVGGCNSTGEFPITIDFDYANPGNDLFDIIYHDSLLNSAALDQLPFTLDRFDAELQSGLDSITICINDRPDCCTTIYFEIPDCERNCRIDSVRTTLLPGDETGAFFVELDVLATEGVSDSFTIATSNSEALGTFAYQSDENPVVGPFRATSLNQLILVLEDVENPNCGKAIEVNLNDLYECNISEVQAAVSDCDENGLFDVTIDFVAEDLLSDSFHVSYRGEQLGAFALADLPITLEDFSADITATNPVDRLFICLNANPNCCTPISFDPPSCSFPQCDITLLRAEALDCDEIGDFFIKMQVEADSASDGYLIYVNGNPIDSLFLYQNGETIIGPFRGGANRVYDIKVQDSDDPECVARTNVTAPECVAEECALLNPSVEVTDCDENGLFDVSLNFTTSLLVNTGLFEVYYRGELVGEFNLLDLPIRIENLRGYNEIDADYLKVCLNLPLLNCCKRVEFDAPDCATETCEITEVIAEAHPCDENGNFLVDLEVRADAASADGFFVFVNGTAIDSIFSYSSTFVTIGPFVGDGETAYEFKIQDVANDDCFKELRLNPMNCQTDDCLITNAEAYAGECHPNGTFDLTLDFTTSVLTSTGLFNVYYQDEVVGSFSLDALPLTLSGLPVSDDDAESHFVKVCFSAIGIECCERIPFEMPECDDDEGCAIEEVEVETTECDDDGSFDIKVDIDTEDTESDSFTVHYRNLLLGTFALADSPVIIENFSDYLTTGNSPNAVVRVSILDGVPCSRAVNFDLPDCHGGTDDCLIEDMDAEIFNCDENGQFYVKIKIDASDAATDTDSFLVRGNGQEYGTFSYGQQVVELGPFDGNVDMVYEFIVKDKANSDCFETVEFDAPECDDDDEDCAITEAILETTECLPDGTFNLVVDFTSSIVVNTALFNVYYRGEIVGEFSLLDLPITLEGLRADHDDEGDDDDDDDDEEEGDDDDDYIKICFLEPLLDCCSRLEFEAPDCDNEGDDCPIEDLEVEVTDCENGQFFVKLKVDSDDGGEAGFTVRGNGQEYGTFSYDEEYIELGPFDSDVNFEYEFEARDVENPDCVKAVGLDDDDIDCDDDDDCHIRNLRVEAGDCRPNGNFPVKIDFEVENAESRFFSIYYRGEWLGSRPIAALPVTIPNFMGSNGSTEEIKVCISGDDGCCATATFETPNCDENACSIESIEVMQENCADQQFFVDLKINAINEGNAGYKVLVDGELYNEYDYSDDYITIGPFAGDGNTIYAVVVQDNEYPYCSNVVAIGPVDCVAECSIYELTAEPLECDTDTTYALKIDFAIENPIGPGFTVYANGNLVGNFAYAELPLTIPQFHSTSEEVEIKVQANDSEACSATTTFSAPDCEDDEVWPGDTDNDNRANHIDLLNIGLGFGTQGPERTGTDANIIIWQGIQAPNWQQTFATGLNYKYADANGDGFIDELDIAAIELNYGLEHGPVDPVPPIVATEDDPVLLVDMPESGELPDGTAFTVPIKLGSEERLAQNVYGIAFTLEFDPNVIDPSSISIDVPTSWMGRLDENLITVQKVYAGEGRAEIAISRTDQRSISGYGTVALFSGIIDDILGFNEVNVGVSEIYAIDNDSKPLPIQPSQTTTYIGDTPTSIEETENPDAIKVFPNPTDGDIQLLNQMKTPIEQIDLLNMNGQLIRRIQPSTNHISLHDLKGGVYLLRIQVGDQIYLRKVVKM